MRKDKCHEHRNKKCKTGDNYHKILDIGTSMGYLAFPLAEEHQTASVYGIDIAETIIEKNNNIVKEKGVKNLVFQAFDGLTYPFDDESFDLVVTRYAFHHFQNVNDAVRQMNKLLIKGGRVLILIEKIICRVEY